MTMLDWLREKKQPRQAIDRFWRQVLVSAINEDLDRMAASHGLQVFALGFLSRRDAYEMGIPKVPLARLYSEEAWRNFPSVRIQERAAVDNIPLEQGRVSCLQTRTGCIRASAYILAIPFERLQAVVPGLPLDVSSFTHSPITGIHLWFDRPITTFLTQRCSIAPFSGCSTREGRHIQLVVSASRRC